MKYLTKEKRYDMINAFNSTSGYLDNLFNIDAGSQNISHRTSTSTLVADLFHFCYMGTS